MKGRHDTKEFIRKAIHPHPCPLPSRERGLKIAPPLRGGDKGEGV
jgi:hypothetical protein